LDTFHLNACGPDPNAASVVALVGPPPYHAGIIAIDRNSYRLARAHERAALQARKRKSKDVMKIRHLLRASGIAKVIPLPVGARRTLAYVATAGELPDDPQEQ
jgi:hypothetical protein